MERSEISGGGGGAFEPLGGGPGDSAQGPLVANQLLARLATARGRLAEAAAEATSRWRQVAAARGSFGGGRGVEQSLLREADEALSAAGGDAAEKEEEEEEQQRRQAAASRTAAATAAAATPTTTTATATTTTTTAAATTTTTTALNAALLIRSKLNVRLRLLKDALAERRALAAATAPAAAPTATAAAAPSSLASAARAADRALLPSAVAALLTRDADGSTPLAFVCPITLEIMADPVCASDGFTYERRAIESLGARTAAAGALSPASAAGARRRSRSWPPGSPMTGEPLLAATGGRRTLLLVPNRVLASAILEWGERTKAGGGGDGGAVAPLPVSSSRV
jgi:hypothetical protein